MSQRGIDAAAEGGAAALQVWCGQPECGKRRAKKGGPLGEVRRSSAGLVFDAELPTGAPLPVELRQQQIAYFRELTGERPPFVVHGRSVVLIEDSDDCSTDPPKVECPRCGVLELDRRELVVRARRWDGTKPVRFVIHRPEHSLG